MHTKSYKYPLLNDREWLYQKYITEKLSTRDIAKLAGAKTANSTGQALTRNGIEIRNLREGVIANRESDGFVLNGNNLSVFEGSLLGDASLRMYNKESKICCPYFYKCNIYYDHVSWVAKFFFPNTWRDTIQKRDKKSLVAKSGRCIIFGFRSLSYDFLLPHYRKWYPESSGYKKVVPKDLKLTKETILHWFLDDGYSELRKRQDYKPEWEKPSRQVRNVFCSESFVYEDQMFLCEQMKQFGLDAQVRKNYCRCPGTGWRIHIPQSQADLFYSIIGPPPVASLAYKWK